MITTMFREKSNMYHISEPIIRRFFFPNLYHFVHFRAVFIDSFSFAMKRCNTSQGFGAFFVQSCDRFLLPFYPFSHFSLSFLIFLTKKVVNFLIKQLLFYAPRWLSIISYPAHPRRIIVKYYTRELFCSVLL